MAWQNWQMIFRYNVIDIKFFFDNFGYSITSNSARLWKKLYHLYKWFNLFCLGKYFMKPECSAIKEKTFYILLAISLFTVKGTFSKCDNPIIFNRSSNSKFINKLLKIFPENLLFLVYLGACTHICHNWTFL